MNKIRYSMRLVLMVVFTVTTHIAAADDSGVGAGGGGDTYSQEFVALGYDILQRLGQSPIPEIDRSRFALAVTQVKVQSKDSLTLGGYNVDAINYPDPMSPRIELSRAGWDRLQSLPHERTFLVLHEYLGILGIDDSRYQISHKIDQAATCSRTDEIRQTLEQYFHISCDRILIKDLSQINELKITLRSGTRALLGEDFRYLYGLVNLSVRMGYWSGVPQN